MADRQEAVILLPSIRTIEGPLSIFESLLRKWQAKINLVGPSSINHVWVRHFVDSAQLGTFAPIKATWVDLGAGAGFPGLVVALLQKREGVGAMHLVESDSRKVAFLREVSRETGAGAFVHHGRAEDLLPALRPDVITSRAMTDLAGLWSLSRTHVENGATAVFPKGRDVAVELTQAAIPSNFSVDLLPSLTDCDARIVRLKAALPKN